MDEKVDPSCSIEYQDDDLDDAFELKSFIMGFPLLQRVEVSNPEMKFKNLNFNISERICLLAHSLGNQTPKM